MDKDTIEEEDGDQSTFTMGWFLKQMVEIDVSLNEQYSATAVAAFQTAIATAGKPLSLTSNAPNPRIEGLIRGGRVTDETQFVLG